MDANSQILAGAIIGKLARRHELKFGPVDGNMLNFGMKSDVLSDEGIVVYGASDKVTISGDKQLTFHVGLLSSLFANAWADLYYGTAALGGFPLSFKFSRAKDLRGALGAAYPHIGDQTKTDDQRDVDVAQAFLSLEKLDVESDSWEDCQSKLRHFDIPEVKFEDVTRSIRRGRNITIDGAFPDKAFYRRVACESEDKELIQEIASEKGLFCVDYEGGVVVSNALSTVLHGLPPNPALLQDLPVERATHHQAQLPVTSVKIENSAEPAASQAEGFKCPASYTAFITAPSEETFGQFSSCKTSASVIRTLSGLKLGTNKNKQTSILISRSGELMPWGDFINHLREVGGELDSARAFKLMFNVKSRVVADDGRVMLE